MDHTILPKWIVQTLGVLLIIFIALLILSQLNNIKKPPQAMSVSAEGRITTVPDLATVTLGVVSEGASAIETKDKNNQKINQIINFIKQQGIDAIDIQTTTFYASPKYNYENGQNILTGYQANQTITVKVRGVDKSQTQLEKILDGAVNNGANQIQGVNFSLLDSDKAKQAARKQAIVKARKKAEELAADANLTLGKTINVIESSNGSIQPMPYAAMSMNAQAKSVAPNIEPGSQEVVESVTVVYEVY